MVEKISQDEFTIDFLEKSYKITCLKSIYKKYGVVLVKHFFESTIFDDILETSLFFFAQVSKKLGLDEIKKKNKLDSLDDYVTRLEKFDRKAVQEVQGLISQTQAITNLSTNKKLINLISELLNIEEKLIIMEGCGGFVPNIPANNKRLYTYHSEAHWLPFRKNFVNCWIPLFRNKEKGKGTMFIKPYSHLDNHDFYEYQGYKSELFSDSYTQYEVPENNKYFEIPLQANFGDIVFFDRNTLHKSELNLSDNVGYLFVNRYFDLSKDLSVSSNLNIRPYSEESRKIGRKINTN